MKNRKQINFVLIIAIVVIALTAAAVPSTIFWDEISGGVIATYNKIFKIEQLPVVITNPPVTDDPTEDPTEDPTDDPTDDPVDEPIALVKDGVNLFNSSSGIFSENPFTYSITQNPCYMYDPIELTAENNYFISCFNRIGNYNPFYDGNNTEIDAILGSSIDISNLTIKIVLSNKLQSDWESNSDVFFYDNGLDARLFFAYDGRLTQDDNLLRGKLNNSFWDNNSNSYISYKYLYIFWRYSENQQYLNNALIKVEYGDYPTSYTSFGVGVEINSVSNTNLFDFSTGVKVGLLTHYYEPIEIAEGNVYSISVYNNPQDAQFVGTTNFISEYRIKIDIWLTYDNVSWWDSSNNFNYIGLRKLITITDGRFDDINNIDLRTTFYNYLNFKYMRISYSFINLEGNSINNALIKIEKGAEPTPYSPYGEGVPL